MKRRVVTNESQISHVTNSSSTCFVCEMCGNTEGGFDLALDEAEMAECINSHVVCQHHLGIDTWPEDASDEFPYEMPAERCPICTLKHVRDKDMLDYVLKMAGNLFPDKDGIGKEIRKGFHNLEELKGWCDES